MAEEKDLTENEPIEGQEQEEKTEKKVDVSELAAQIEQLKKLQAGSDKAYQQAAEKLKAIESENEKLKKEQMTEKERAQFELEKQRKELEEKDREVKTQQANYYKAKVVNEQHLPGKVMDYIKGETEADILASAEALRAVLDEYATAKVNEAMGTVSKPAAGSGDESASKDISKLSIYEVEDLIKKGKL